MKKTTKKSVKKTSKLITKNMTIGEVVQKYPKSSEIFFKHGLHCIGCHVAFFETIEQGCSAHGLSKEQTDDLIEDLNKSSKK